jgi:hypothetical protein
VLEIPVQRAAQAFAVQHLALAQLFGQSAVGVEYYFGMKSHIGGTLANVVDVTQVDQLLHG